MVAAHSKISPQLKCLAVPLAGVNLDPQNARQHDERGIASIKASLERFGQVKPIVIQKRGRIVRAGNATVMAARELGWTEIAANVKSMSDAEARAYAIADNRTAELAAWDQDALASILTELQVESSKDAASTGYTDDEIAALIAQLADSGEVGALMDAFRASDGSDDVQISFVFSPSGGNAVIKLCKTIGKPAVTDLIVDLCRHKLPSTEATSLCDAVAK